MKQVIHRRPLLSTRLIAVAGVILACLVAMPRAVAAQDGPLPSRLTIQALAPITVGDRATLAVQLTTATGELVGALDNEALQLLIDGQPERRIRTDAQGKADIPIQSELTVGSHALKVVYAGSQDLGPAEAASQLVVVPATLVIQTVPALANVAFSLGDRSFSSGPDGIARISVDTAGTYPLKLLTPKIETQDTRATFSRWRDDQFDPARPVDIPIDQPLQIGFDVSQRISWSYVDLDNSPVDPGRATSVTVKGTHGVTQVFHDYQPEWLLASRTVRLQGGLQVAKIQWGVQSVMVDGANTVNQGQQRFYVEPGDNWKVQLLLFTAHLSAQDALFGFPVGSGFNLVYPNGSEEFFPAGPDGTTVAALLARGQYAAGVVHAPGLAPAAPIALTREQDVQLRVISYFDLTVFILVLGSVSLGLLFVGRPRLLAWVPTPLRRKNGRMAPLWTTGVLLLVLIGAPSITASYLLTVKPAAERSAASSRPHPVSSELAGSGGSGQRSGPGGVAPGLEKWRSIGKPAALDGSTGFAAAAVPASPPAGPLAESGTASGDWDPFGSLTIARQVAPITRTVRSAVMEGAEVLSEVMTLRSGGHQ